MGGHREDRPIRGSQRNTRGQGHKLQQGKNYYYVSEKNSPQGVFKH